MIYPVSGSGVKPSAFKAQAGASVIHSLMAVRDFAPVRTSAATAHASALKVEPTLAAPGIGHAVQESSQVNGVEKGNRVGYRGQLAQRGGDGR